MPRPRAFTVDEANDLIPWVESVFERLDGHHERWQAHAQGAQILEVMWGERVLSPDNPDHDELLQHHRGLEEAARTVEGVIAGQLLARGIRFPAGGLEHGIVDFPTSFRGRWILLCWQRGERRISHWHEVDAGFRGRRELTPEDAAVMGLGDLPADDAALGR